MGLYAQRPIGRAFPGGLGENWTPETLPQLEDTPKSHTITRI